MSFLSEAPAALVWIIDPLRSSALLIVVRRAHRINFCGEGGRELRGDQAAVVRMWVLVEESELKIGESEKIKKHMKMIILLMCSDVI